MPDRISWAEIDAIAAEPSRRERNGRTSRAGAPLEWRTAAALLEDAPDEELRWLPFLGQDGVIVEGCTHLVASGVRVGKTAILARAAVGWLRLGRTVVWFTEESWRTWRQRVNDLRGIYGVDVPWANLVLCYAVGADPAAMLEFVVQRNPRIVVADTVRHILQAEDENDAGTIRAALSPWLEATDGRTFIALTHNRKGRPEGAADAVAGSHVLASMFDVILQVRETDDENARRLTGRSRLFEVVPLTVSKDDEGRMFVSAGQQGTYSTAEMDRRVHNAVARAARPLTTRDVRALVEPPPSLDTVNRALLRLAGQGCVTRDPVVGEDAKGRIVTWSAASADLFGSAVPQAQTGAEVTAPHDQNAAEPARGGGAAEADSLARARITHAETSSPADVRRCAPKEEERTPTPTTSLEERENLSTAGATSADEEDITW